MTQEIGFIEPFEKDEPIDFDGFPIGSILELLQYHSCDTAAKFQVVISKVPRLNIKSHSGQLSWRKVNKFLFRLEVFDFQRLCFTDGVV